jgi:hypothetical protein
MGLTASLTGAALFAIAPAVGWVFAGRALMGLGVGLAMGPASAAVIEFSAKGATKRAGAITTTATAVGLALAAHAGGLLIDFGPDPTLQQRWDEGQHSAKILHEELQTKGYLGHYERVKMAVAPLRRGLPPGRATRATALTTRSRPLDHHPPGSPQPTDQRPPAAAPAHRALS